MKYKVIDLLNFLKRWSAPNLCAACLESLVFPLAQEVPRLDVHLAADPNVSVCMASPFLDRLLECYTEVSARCPVGRPSYPG